MANDPKDGAGGQLHNANAGAAAGGGGAAGAAAAPCTWDLFVKVHSQEKFWPKDPFNVKVCNLTPAGDLGAADFTQPIQMIAKDSPEAHFCGSGVKHYGVTATVKDLVKEKDWVLAAGRTSKHPLAKDYAPVTLHPGNSGHRAKHVDLYTRHPLEVHLQLKFKDPENHVLTFPENFPILVYAGKSPAKKILDVKTTAEGKLDFEMDRAYNWFTLKFGGSKLLISNGDGSKSTCNVKDWKDKQALEDAKARFFSPPSVWGLIESDWAFSANPKYINDSVAYKPAEGKVYIFDPPTKNWVRRIGEKGAPITLTLDPHWQFLRFEYFDRYFGHTDHNSGHTEHKKRVNTPTVFVEGYWSTDGKDRKREGGGFWTINPDKLETSAHCLPWIRQKDSAGADQKRPDKNSLLMFATQPGTFSSSVDNATRKLEVLTPKKDKDRLKPSADRLKLYDLPTTWKSTHYFARFKDAAGNTPGKFFEDWAAADHLKSHSAATPMVFSLDDIVLTDSTGNTLKFAAADLFAVFHHRFKQSYNETNNVSHIGIYKPGWKAAAPPVEPVDSGTLKGKDFNYVTDYPNWVRMVAGRSSLFEAFDQRSKGSVTGARAAMRYYNPAASGAGPGGAVPAAGLIKKPFFVMRPYYQATYPLFVAQFLPEPKCPLEQDGRFDMVLLRCCDHDGDKELFMNMSYFRFFYTFLANSTVAGAAAQKKYAHDSASNLMTRWNGNDVALANNIRAELRPQDASKLWGESIFFVQAVTTNQEAHFKMKVQNIALAGGRASMNSNDGMGEVDDKDFQPTNAFGDPLDFVLAHEFGHGASLPDEYSEWWNNCCDNGPGILCNTPGDPFVDEGTSVEFVPDAAHKVSGSSWAMMNMAVQVRNRYFWHNAEFARKYVDGVPFFVKHGALATYKVPGHPNYPKQTYTYWPIKALISSARGQHGKFDVYLHATGPDAFTVTLLPNLWKTAGPVDGILSLLHRIRLRLPAAFVAGANPAPPPPAFVANPVMGQFRDAIRNAANALTGKFYAKGTAKVKTDQGIKDLPLNKVLMRFSPRFLIHPANFNPRDANDTPAKYTVDFNSLAANVGTQYRMNVLQSGGAAPAPGFNHGKYGLDLVVDLTKLPAVAAAALTAQAKQFYVEMLGVKFDPVNPNLKKEDLKGIAALVIKTNPDVGNLP